MFEKVPFVVETNVEVCRIQMLTTVFVNHNAVFNRDFSVTSGRSVANLNQPLLL